MGLSGQSIIEALSISRVEHSRAPGCRGLVRVILYSKKARADKRVALKIF